MLPESASTAFVPLRKRLFRIAYRMLGSVAEAEDVVQDAYVRWHQTDHAEVRDPTGFLVRIVTRLCLDVLKSARATREEYYGPWLPEPVIDAGDLETFDEVTMTLMIALERLSPLERAAFLLHDVFGVEFDEVAQVIDRAPATCRQLASRARTHLRNDRPRFQVPRERGIEIAQAFFAASRQGELPQLETLLAEDVAVYTDGGGKVRASVRPILGRDKAARFFAGISRKPNFSSQLLLADCILDGLPGFITREAGGLLQSTALDISEGKICAIYIVRNPDKLMHLSALGDK